MELVKPFGKKVLTKLIAQIYKRYHTTETSIMLDKMKDSLSITNTQKETYDE